MGNISMTPQMRTSVRISQNKEQQQGKVCNQQTLFQQITTDAIFEAEEQQDPLIHFLSVHMKNKRPFCASNQLNFQTSPSLPKAQTQKIEVASSNSRKNLDKKPVKRMSIEVGSNMKQFTETIKEFVFTEKLMESYGRIQINQEKFIHLRKESIAQYYRFQDEIGRGSFGSVHKAVCLLTHEKRAVKVIRKDAIIRPKMKEVFAELQLLKKLDHPNIIKLYEVFESKNNFEVVTELCSGGSIIDFIKVRTHFDENIIRVILKQLLCCLNYLHKLRIVHRDIKLENVMFIQQIKDSSSSDEVDLKLLDFGTAFKMTRAKIRCKDLVGTVSYLPPEIIKGYFTDKCDIWSCGVIFYILLTSKSPFKCKTKEETISKILNHQIRLQQDLWMGVSNDAKDLLLKMLQKDPVKRVSADEALKHPWFRSKDSVSMKSSSFLRNLNLYFRQNNLISVLESYLIFSRMGQDERKRISQIFKEIDRNNDGFIEKEELIAAYKQNMPEEFNLEEIHFVLNKLDKDQSGSINFNEFASALAKKEKLWAKDALEEAFDYFDINKTGFIERNELKLILDGSENEEIENLLKELDIDKDQKISKSQFTNYFLKQGYLY